MYLVTRTTNFTVTFALGSEPASCGIEKQALREQAMRYSSNYPSPWSFSGSFLLPGVMLKCPKKKKERNNRFLKLESKLSANTLS